MSMFHYLGLVKRNVFYYSTSKGCSPIAIDFRCISCVMVRVVALNMVDRGYLECGKSWLL